MTRGTDVAQYTRCHVQAVTIELLGLLRPGVAVTQFRLGTRGGTETNKKARAGGEYIDLLLIARGKGGRSEEHTSELQSLMRISYAVFCLKKKKNNKTRVKKLIITEEKQIKS